MSNMDKDKDEYKVHATTVEELQPAHVDTAGQYLLKVSAGPDADSLLRQPTDAEVRGVVRRADLIIVPLLLVALMMGAVDKNALSTAAVLGLRTDLGLVGQQYSWSGSLIFFGSMVSLFPALFLMQRFPAAKVIAINVTVWGVISMCIAATHNFAGLAVCRFVLGVFEAITFPGFSLIIASWYTRKEMVTRTALIYSTLSSVTNGVLSYAVSFVGSGSAIAAWQLLFLLVGIITFLWGVLVGVFLPDSPVSAWWLSERQRCVAVLRLQENRTGVENKRFKWSQAKEALMDPKTYLVFLINICLNVPNGGISTFNSIIVSSLGYSSRITTLLSIPTGLISYAGSLFFSWVAVRTGQRCLTAVGACFLPLLSTILLHVIPRTNIGGSLGSLYLVYFFWGPYVLMVSSVMSNTGGYTKKTIAYGFSYLGYLVGNIIGPQTFRSNQAPAYTGGVVAMLICYCVAIMLILTYYVYLRYLNRRKEAERAQHPVDPESDDLVEDWRDETDWESKRFVYVL